MAAAAKEKANDVSDNIKDKAADALEAAADKAKEWASKLKE